MRMRTVVGLLAVAVVVAAVAVPRLVSRGRAAPSPDARAAGEAARALPVEVVRLAPRLLVEQLSTTGTVRANEQVELVSEITGTVERIAFREGSAVRRGDLLVKIVDDELQAQRERVVHRLRLAEIREERQRELREQGIVSEQDYDVAGAELDVLRAELRLVDAQIEKTEIRAPFDGVVGLRWVSEGSLLTPQTRIATLQNLDPVKIDFTLPERYAGRIAPGDAVAFRVKGSETRREARVFAVEPRISAETRSLMLRARSRNADGRLMPGAFADVVLAVDEVPDALVVPSLAVVPELGGKKVFVVEDGRAQPRRVETGIRTDTEVALTVGVEPGDVVIVSAIQRLRPGLAVEAIARSATGEREPGP